MALDTLRREPEGSFVVRSSNSRSGRLALTVRVPTQYNPSGIVHYLIVRAPKGFRIKVYFFMLFFISIKIFHQIEFDYYK